MKAPCFLSCVLMAPACADPVVYSAVVDGEDEDLPQRLRVQPSSISIQSEAGGVHLLELHLRADGPVFIDGILWEGDETWELRSFAPSLPIRVEDEVELQIQLRTGLPILGGALVFWGRDRILGRVPVERRIGPSLRLIPREPRGVGVVGTRLRLPMSVRSNAAETSELSWRVVADPALQVESPADFVLEAGQEVSVDLLVDALRPGTWRLGLGVLGPDTEDWVEAELQFQSAEAWRFTVTPEPDQTSALITDLRRLQAWADLEDTPPSRGQHMLVGSAEASTRLGVGYLEDCRAAPSTLLSELFGASLSTLVAGSAEWSRLVREVCVDRGPLNLRWTLEQGGALREGQTRLERRGDRVEVGRWDGPTRRFEVTR
ncbi:MAG: hypothetical protein AAF627_13525 [Myxococcota bacterium]